MIKYDIHSAYHHILIKESQTDMLGFSLEMESQTIYFLIFSFTVRNELCSLYVYTAKKFYTARGFVV